MSFRNWDQEIAPHLGRIETCAERAIYYVDEIIKAITVLKTKPEFTTKAQFSMETLGKKIKEAITSYQSLPTGDK